MSGLRASLDEMVADTPVYGDLDRAIQQVARGRQRHVRLGMGLAAVAAVLVLVVGAVAVNRDRAEDPQPAGPPPTTATDSTAPTLRALADGPVEPGRYRYSIQDPCDPRMGCSPQAANSLPDIAVTVPAGWNATNEFHLIEPATQSGTGAPDGAGLVLGWTTYHVGLYSEPCRPVEDSAPDLPVGPTVDAFVDAVTAHPKLHVTEPTRVRLGGYRGRFFTLMGPGDISGCAEWRPWDPSPYLQGPRNRWDLWAMDVDGVRLLIMAGYYPGTSKAVRTELHDMVDSIQFLPSKIRP